MTTTRAGHAGRAVAAAYALVALALLGAPFLAPPALAQEKEGEIWVGSYQPDPSALDDDISFGLRSIFRRPEGLGFGVELGYVAVSGEVTDGTLTGDLDWDSFFVDGVFDLPLGHSKKVVPAFTFGTGIAFTSADSSIEGRVGSVEVDDLEATSFTVQAGFGVRILLGDKFYIRPAARVRWFEARGDEDLDTEYLIGFGRAF
jgi:hypothetical protein